MFELIMNILIEMFYLFILVVLMAMVRRIHEASDEEFGKFNYRDGFSANDR